MASKIQFVALTKLVDTLWAVSRPRLPACKLHYFVTLNLNSVNFMNSKSLMLFLTDFTVTLSSQVTKSPEKIEAESQNQLFRSVLIIAELFKLIRICILANLLDKQ